MRENARVRLTRESHCASALGVRWGRNTTEWVCRAALADEKHSTNRREAGMLTSVGKARRVCVHWGVLDGTAAERATTTARSSSIVLRSLRGVSV